MASDDEAERESSASSDFTTTSVLTPFNDSVCSVASGSGVDVIDFPSTVADEVVVTVVISGAIIEGNKAPAPSTKDVPMPSTSPSSVTALENSG